MKYLHTMVRVNNLDTSLDFYCNKLGLQELRRYDSEQGRFTLVFLAAPGDQDAQVELTHNWDPEEYTEGRNFGHLAYQVDDIYALCQKLMDEGGTICRPPREGHMAFVCCPDNVWIERRKRGEARARRHEAQRGQREQPTGSHMEGRIPEAKPAMPGADARRTPSGLA